MRTQQTIRPGHGRRGARVAQLTATCLFAVGPTAQAQTFSTWSATNDRLYEEPDYASLSTTAAGRIWQVSFDRQTRPVLRRWRLTDGRDSAVPVSVPRPRGGVLLSESSGGRDTQLLVAGRRGFVAGDWCTSQTDDGDCERTRGFDVQFSTRTGRVLRSATPAASPLLVGGTRVSYVVRPDEGPVLLRDAITRRVVRRLPHDAREIQGAGPFVAWKDPDAYERRNGEDGADVGPDFDAVHVIERTSGRRVYDLRLSALRRVVQPKGHVGVQQLLLAADGSLYLSADVDDTIPLRPVAVDGRGVIRRLTERPMNGPIQFSSEIRGTRALFDVNDNGERGCLATGWLTEVGGRRGSRLLDLPHTRGYALAQVPSFESSSRMSWLEKTPRGDGTDRYRVRVGGDLRTLPLTRGQRPRC